MNMEGKDKKEEVVTVFKADTSDLSNKLNDVEAALKQIEEALVRIKKLGIEIKIEVKNS